MSARHGDPAHHNIPRDSRFSGPVDRYAEFELLSRIASRYYLEDRTQAEVAEEFGLSRQKVQRLLRQAREQHIVEIHVHAVPVLQQELESRFRAVFDLDQVIIAPSHPDEDERRRSTARAAASYLERHLTDGAIVAVGLGRNTRAVADFFRPARRITATFVSAMGGSPSLGRSINPNEICAAFAARSGGRAEPLYAPAYVEDRIVRNSLYGQAAIAYTLNIARQSRITIMGIGTADDASILVQAGCVSPEEVLQLRGRGAVGEFLGNYFDRDGGIVPSELEGRRVGLTLDELRHIPTIMAVASESEKALAVLGALRTGVIGALIVASDLALAVLCLAGVTDLQEAERLLGGPAR